MPHCTFICEGPTAPLSGGRYPPTAPPVGGGYLPPGRGGGRLPLGAKMRLNVNFIYIEVPTARQEGGRGPAARQPGGRGTKL